MPEAARLAPGMRVLCRDCEWLVTRVDPADYGGRHSAVHCVGVDDLVRGRESIFLTQLDHIERVDPLKTQLIPDPTTGFKLSRLFLEAQLRQMPVTTEEPDPSGMGAFEPMRFQLEAVRRALEQLRPRLLLADAVGLGKTIQVGMILSELMRRGRADKILVLAKKSMLTQLQSELWNRFGIPLVRLDSVGIARLRLRIPANKNPFEVYPRVIISIDTLKNIGSYKHFLEHTHWDCVVIDEAHNVAGASVPERHLSYRLARLLSRRTHSMLLTTATPHNGQRQTFGRLISLLDPSAIPDPEFKEYDATDIAGFFFMRLKEDVRTEIARNLPERMIVPATETTAAATPGEEAVFRLFAEARQAGLDGTATWPQEPLLQWGLYKQFLSSPESCRQTVQARQKKLRAKDQRDPELPYLQKLDAALAPLSLQESSRFRLLLDQLRALKWDGRASSPRVIIFTEYRATQDALARAIAAEFGLSHSEDFETQPQQVIAAIHGSFPDVWLMKTIEAFGTGKSAMRMLIATDVASEGINLHHECHNLIHYDLPWSIITLIQRNGRIDRIGQTKPPLLRYLQVRTQSPVFAGDEIIFQKLITKVEEINRSTRTGESVLKLYDPEAEERYIAEQGLLKSNASVLERSVATATEAASLEQILQQAAELDDDYLKLLLGETDETPEVAEPAAAPPAVKATSRLRLLSDWNFFIEGYRHLAESQSDFLPLEIKAADRLIELQAPPELRRRLGSPDAGSDVIFGATAIPEEAWPTDNRFVLSDQSERIEMAIKAARQQSGYWSRELLMTDQHPVLRWITERLLMLMPRGQCPHVLSRKLSKGELCFCFIGQVSSKAGTPFVVDAHAIRFQPGGKLKHCSLETALRDAGFDSLVNDGRVGSAVAQTLLPAAIKASREHLQRLRISREQELAKLVRIETRRLKNWLKRRRSLLTERIEQLGEHHPRARRYQQDLQEMDGWERDREENWLRPYFSGSAEPATNLVLVIEGG